MNKLACASILGLMSGVACAQSTVTVFGVVDMSVRYVKTGNASISGVGTDGLVPSRLGFRGSEDLGNGLAAGFWLESTLIPDTGNVAAKFWNRRSTVSLTSASLGELRLGRDFDPTFLNLNQFDPFGALTLGTPVNMFSTLGSGSTTLLRTDNGVQYYLPRDLGGIYGNLSVAAGEGTVGNRYTGGRIGFARGPVNIAAALGETTGNGGDKFKVGNVAASYDFGPAKVTGWFHQSKFRALKQNVWLVGATVPLGQLDLRATFSKSDASGGGTDANDAKQLVLGAVYNLSKRTAIYATAARLENEGRAAFVVAAPPTAVAGARSTGFDLGIRHSF